MRPTKEEPEGWGHSHHSHRVHFFISKASLCGDYALRTYVKQGRNDMSRQGPQDCAACWQRLKELGKA